MAKSKKSGKKSKTTKPAVKDEKLSEQKNNKKTVEEKVEKAETEKVEEVEMVEKKEKTEKKKEEKVEKAEKCEEKTCEKKPCEGFWKTFFAKKYEENESILTIFKCKRIYGAILGEVFGTMVLSLIVFTLGLSQPLYMFFIVAAVILAVYKLSGANINPINTVGMMVTRRMSVIRGVLYLLSQVVGAWLGFLIFSAFLGASAGLSGSEVEAPGMTMAEEGYYWIVTMIEFVGAAIVGFFFARAQQQRKNPAVYAVIAAGGVTVGMIVVYLISYSYFGLTGNFMLNPAIALMYQIMPTSADGVGQLLLEIGKALLTYVVLPMAGGVLGFWLSDLAKTLADEGECCKKCECKCEAKK